MIATSIKIKCTVLEKVKVIATSCNDTAELIEGRASNILTKSRS